MKLSCKVWFCTRCQTIGQSYPGKGHSIKDLKAPDEDRCPDPKAPGGYWYCSYIELVPKKVRKGPKKAK